MIAKMELCATGRSCRRFNVLFAAGVCTFGMIYVVVGSNEETKPKVYWRPRELEMLYILLWYLQNAQLHVASSSTEVWDFLIKRIASSQRPPICSVRTYFQTKKSTSTTLIFYVFNLFDLHLFPIYILYIAYSMAQEQLNNPVSVEPTQVASYTNPSLYEIPVPPPYPITIHQLIIAIVLSGDQHLGRVFMQR